MCAAKAAAGARAISAAEAKILFADLASAPAIVIAVSGGPDSTALLFLLARWRAGRKSGPKLLGVTVDHGLRAESKREAQQVKRLARKLGVAHRTLRWAGEKPSGGLQEKARRARYRLLADAAAKTGASHLLTAHTLDDQAETVLMRFLRGSGAAGLAGMARETLLSAPSPQGGEGRHEGERSFVTLRRNPRRASRVDLSPQGRGEEKNSGQIILLRPLLDIPKARLIATLRAAKTPFADDASNADPRFTRVRMRALLPALATEGLSAERLAVLARRMRRADAALDFVAAQALAALSLTRSSNPAITFDARGFAALPDEVALRLLGRSLAQVGDEGPVELAKLEALHRALADKKAPAAVIRRTLAGAMVTLAADRLTVERAPARRSRRPALTTRPGGRAKTAKTR